MCTKIEMKVNQTYTSLMKERTKNWIKISGVLFIVLLVIPYLIPLNTPQALATQPYPNSVTFITSDGVLLHGQLEVASPSKGKVVLIHGFGASSFSYRFQIPALHQAGYTVLAVDLPAFGYSSRDRNLVHSNINRAQWIWEWMDQLSLDLNDSQTWSIVGHSMGASVALAMADLKPKQTLSLNLIGPAIVDETPSSAWLVHSPLGQWLKVIYRYGLSTQSQFSKLLESAYAQTPSQEAVEGYLKPTQIQGSVEAFFDFVASAQSYTLNQFRHTEIPTTLFWGEDDTWISPTQRFEIQDKLNVIKTYLYPNEGHCVHETSTSFNDDLIQTLDSYVGK